MFVHSLTEQTNGDIENRVYASVSEQTDLGRVSNVTRSGKPKQKMRSGNSKMEPINQAGCCAGGKKGCAIF